MMMEARRSLLCITPGCKYVRHTDINNNGGKHCCFKCKSDGGKHGGKCKKRHIKFMKCDRNGCNLVKNPDIFNNGGTHCCKHCKDGKKQHGGLCTKRGVGRGAEVKEEKVDVEILEEIHGMNFPHLDIKSIPCSSLQEARAIAAREISANRNTFAAFCNRRKKVWINKHADKNHPKIKTGKVNPDMTLFYLKALFELGTAKCNRLTCNFMKDTDQHHGFCCLMCKTGGFHGPLCKQQGMGAVIREERMELKCERQGCRFMKHKDINNNGGTHCCSHCKRKGDGHGRACAKLPVGKVIKQELKCDRAGCHFVKNPDQKNNGGTHCCNACKKHGRHGGACTKRRVGEIMKEVATGFA